MMMIKVKNIKTVIIHPRQDSFLIMKKFHFCHCVGNNDTYLKNTLINFGYERNNKHD